MIGLVAGAVLSAAVLTACSASTPAGPPPQTASNAPTAAATASPTIVAPADAATMLAKLKAAGLPVGASATVTAADDPNHLLGRPGGYTSKVYWTDTSIDPAQVTDALQKGGEIETYPDAAGATTRASYIQAIAKSAPMFAEYDYVVGTSVLRLSSLLTPDQAAKYKAAAF